MKLNVKDFGVSPVIGTILLVAITVVLVAIIAAVVMGMSSGVSNTKNVGLTVTPDAYINTASVYNGGGTQYSDEYYPGVTVIIMGGKDVDSLRNLTVFVEGSGDGSGANAFYAEFIYDGNGMLSGGKTTEELDLISNPIGSPFFYIPYYEGEEGNYDNVLVIVKGTFADGTEHILYQGRLTLPTSAPSGHDIVMTDMKDFNDYPTSPRFV